MGTFEERKARGNLMLPESARNSARDSSELELLENIAWEALRVAYGLDANGLVFEVDDLLEAARTRFLPALDPWLQTFKTGKSFDYCCQHATGRYSRTSFENQPRIVPVSQPHMTLCSGCIYEWRKARYCEFCSGCDKELKQLTLVWGMFVFTGVACDTCTTKALMEFD